MAHHTSGYVQQRFSHGTSLHDFSRQDKKRNGYQRKGVECTEKLRSKEDGRETQKMHCYQNTHPQGHRNRNAYEQQPGNTHGQYPAYTVHIVLTSLY